MKDDISELFPIGSLVRFNQDYYEDYDKLLSFIGLVIHRVDVTGDIRIIWENGDIEEYGNMLAHQLEMIT